MRIYRKKCPYCEEPFETPNMKKVFCCTLHRRAYQTKCEREARAEKAESYPDYPMRDVWSENSLPPAITENALLDGWTGIPECVGCPDEAIAGLMACQRCRYLEASRKAPQGFHR